MTFKTKQAVSGSFSLIVDPVVGPEHAAAANMKWVSVSLYGFVRSLRGFMKGWMRYTVASLPEPFRGLYANSWKSQRGPPPIGPENAAQNPVGPSSSVAGFFLGGLT